MLGKRKRCIYQEKEKKTATDGLSREEKGSRGGRKENMKLRSFEQKKTESQFWRTERTTPGATGPAMKGNNDIVKNIR